MSVAILATFTSSCSRDTRLPLYSVSGSVTFKRNPRRKAIVVLRPIGPDAIKDLLPHGEVGPDGNFQIGTYVDGDGAPAGDYIVTITWPDSRTDPKTRDEVSEDRLKGRYSDPARSKWKSKS